MAFGVGIRHKRPSGLGNLAALNLDSLLYQFDFSEHGEVFH
ncbi:MAG TPA: hypothetical protein VJI68_01995 [Candidatus Nanoarchaeia archaeon]|nr:hypothetical protein [Candidatus Nanoarchaeia archaeon]